MNITIELCLLWCNCLYFLTNDLLQKKVKYEHEHSFSFSFLNPMNKYVNTDIFCLFQKTSLPEEYCSHQHVYFIYITINNLFHQGHRYNT